MRTVDEEAGRLGKVLGHPVRLRIVELIGERGPLTWKELSAELPTKTGALYHHLDILEGLVVRDSSKKYSLTKYGLIVHARLEESNSPDSLRRAAQDVRESARLWRAASAVLAPRSLIVRLVDGRKRSMASLACLSAAAEVVSLGTGGVANLYYFRPGGDAVSATVGFFGSLGSLTAACYVFAFLFRSKASALQLTSAAAFSFLPAMLFSAGASLNPAFAFFASAKTVYTLCLMAAEAWSACILAAGLSSVSGVRIEKALLVSLTALYASTILIPL